MNHTIPSRTVQRARALPYPRPFIKALSFSAGVFIMGVSTATAATCLALSPSPSTSKMFFLLLGLTILSWIAAYFARKKATCPLCSGTPLLDSGAAPHQKAVRLFPLNYGTTNLVRSVVTQKFCCQFCATDFDYLKPYNRKIELQTEKRKIPPCQLGTKPVVSAPPNRKNRHV